MFGHYSDSGVTLQANSSSQHLMFTVWYFSAIFLSSMKMPFEEIKKKILHCDNDLSESALESLQKYLPSSKEVGVSECLYNFFLE